MPVFVIISPSIAAANYYNTSNNYPYEGGFFNISQYRFIQENSPAPDHYIVVYGGSYYGGEDNQLVVNMVDDWKTLSWYSLENEKCQLNAVKDSIGLNQIYNYYAIG